MVRIMCTLDGRKVVMTSLTFCVGGPGGGAGGPGVADMAVRLGATRWIEAYLAWVFARAVPRQKEGSVEPRALELSPHRWTFAEAALGE
jgi:hypothetical protein